MYVLTLLFNDWCKAFLAFSNALILSILPNFFCSKKMTLDNILKSYQTFEELFSFLDLYLNSSL